MKIPADRRFFVSNASDLTPSIHYVKNIDFDEEGYLKLSPPFPKLIGQDELATAGIFLDAIMIGANTAQTYKLATDLGILDVDLDTLSVALDASAPATLNTYGRFVGWKGGDWYYNASSDIYSLQTTAGTVWDVENTDGIDYAEVFINRNTLAGATASGVDQFTTADMDGTTPTGNNSSTTVTLPSNFRIMGLSYSNYRLGIATRNTTGGNAYFFVWDGATTSASIGVPVFAQSILDVVAYQNSWVILTSAGQLLYFNGGGFDVLGNLPPYYFNANWLINEETYHGRIMFVDGDVIYFNLGSLLEASQDDSGILPGFYSGMWCFDPVVGIYHRYGLAYSKLYTGSISATSAVFTSTAHLLLSGDKVLYSNGTTYYAIYVTDDTFKLADTYDLAIAGTASADFGTSNYTLSWIKRVDWSQLTTNNQNFGGCVFINNGSNLLGDGVLPFFAGAYVVDNTMSGESITCVMAPAFDNIGCIAYQKVKAQGILDNWQKLVVKYRPLQGGDKIVVKYKYKDFFSKPIGIGEAGDISADSGDNTFITWTDSDTFTTTKDLTGVEAGHEVEFFSGAGAGSTAHISSLSESGGTWTVNLDETIRGASNGKKSTCLIDCFYKLETITKDNQTDENLYEKALTLASKFIQVKLELRGRDVTIEELEIISAPHQ